MPNQHQLRKTHTHNPYNEEGITTCYAEMEYWESESEDCYHYEGEFNSRHSIPDINRWIKSKNVGYSLDAYEGVFGDVSSYEEGNIENCEIDFNRPDWEFPYLPLTSSKKICQHDKEISKLKSLRLQ